MINKLYSFTFGTFVVADEWNANFKALANSNADCVKAIEDAKVSIAFPDNDLTQLFNAVRKNPNSFAIAGSTVIVQPECEYYKALTDGEDLAIQIPTGLNAEARVIIRTSDNRSLLPFTVLYSGDTNITYGEDMVFPAGVYYIMIYETAGQAQVKLIWTGE